MIITPTGEEIVVYEDELLMARDNNVINQNDVDDAYQTLKQLEKKYVNNFNELSKINFDAVAYFYLTGGGTPFVLDKIKKICTIHNEVLAELLNIIKNNYHTDNESTEISVNNKIIKFTKK